MQTTDEVTIAEAVDGVAEYRIPESNLWHLTKEIGKLNKRADKLGIEAAQLVPIRTEEKVWTETDSFGRERKMREVYHVFTLQSEPVKLAGWTFLGTLEHAGEAGTILKALPGETIPASYRTSDPANCDHCHTSRRRTETFVFRHEDGAHKQIGRQCLRDFFGTDPAQLVAMAEWLMRLEGAVGHDSEYGDHGRSGDGTIEAENYLAFVNAAISNWGWVSRGKARDSYESATADIALGGYRNRDECDSDCYNQPCQLHFQPTKEQGDEAVAILAWAREEEGVLVTRAADEANDYEYNLKVVTSLDWWGPKMLGIGASLISYYRRAQEREIKQQVERQAAAERPASEWFGEIGQRLDVTAKVMAIIEVNGNFGLTSIHKLLVDGHNEATWFSSSLALERGKTYVLKGTVKAHDEYKGAKQTVISRCKVVKEVE